jgi:hypothetical protein
LQQAIRGGPASGSGLATLGEASAALLRAGADPDGLAERVRCTAGMLVERQHDGAWFTNGVTRMDAQQHALSALLAAEPALRAGDDAIGGGEEAHSALWLAIAALAASNPLRPGPRRKWWRIAVAAGAAAGLALLSGPLLDWLDVSPASARMAAGVGLGVAAILTVVRPDGASGAVGGAVALVTLAVGADDGWRTLPAIALAAAACAFVPGRWRQANAARVVAVVAFLMAVDLVYDGVLGA